MKSNQTSKQKFKRMALRHSAVETYLVRHKGRVIKVYQMPIPGFWGRVSDEVLELAAERAYKKGWRKIVLTWGEMLSSCCFDDGYVWLLAMNISMARRSDSHYNVDSCIICDMDKEGNVFREPPPRDTEYDRDNATWARIFENDGMDMMD